MLEKWKKTNNFHIELLIYRIQWSGTKFNFVYRNELDRLLCGMPTNSIEFKDRNFFFLCHFWLKFRLYRLLRLNQLKHMIWKPIIHTRSTFLYFRFEWTIVAFVDFNWNKLRNETNANTNANQIHRLWYSKQ